METDKVAYRFELENREIRFDVATRPSQAEAEGEHPEWAKLGFHQCSCCPLKEKDCIYCPAATRINEVMEVFSGDVSTDRVKVTVDTAARSYVDECDLQTGLNSLMGLMMATSGCPVLKKLGAMASFHIPFCTTRETLQRTVGSYLIKQYFKQLNGEAPDWELEELKELYGVLEVLNQEFSKRIQASISSDAVSNAVIMFFATSVLVANSLEHQLEKHKDYLTNAPSSD